jgi:4-aminobutyrate aminotransferase-like enzyme
VDVLEDVFRRTVEAKQVAAVIVEPVLGEGGFVVPPQDWLPRLRALTARHGILLIADEVQTGFGRTGRQWAVEHSGVVPDILIAAKSIAGGLPLSSITGRAEVMDAPGAGGLGGTFGGNPLSCAAALAVLDVVTDQEFLAGARQLGVALRARLDELASGHSEIGEVRGLGSMLAFEFAERTPERAQAVVSAAFERGLVLLSCGLYGNVIRLLPPLTIADDDLDEGLTILEDSLGA